MKNIFLSLFIKVSYLHWMFAVVLLPFSYWWHLHTAHIFRSNAAPLIYHVFNVEQDQVIRDSEFDIRAGMARGRDRNKTKASQSHELSRDCSMAPTGLPCVHDFSHSVSLSAVRTFFRLESKLEIAGSWWTFAESSSALISWSTSMKHFLNSTRSEFIWRTFLHSGEECEGNFWLI